MNAARDYPQRLRDRMRAAARCERWNSRWGTVRLLLAAAGIATLWLSFGTAALNPAWLSLPVAAFAAVVLVHHRIRVEAAQARRSVEFYHDAIERMAGRETARHGAQNARSLEASIDHHEYGADLDLFGERGLFARLCVARTPMGEATLAAWLLQAADLDVLHERHAAIKELSSMVDLREAWSVVGEPPSITLVPAALVAWADAPYALDRRWVQVVAPVLVALALAAAALWYLTGVVYPFLGVLLLELAMTYAWRRGVQDTIAGVETAHEDLKLLFQLMQRLEAAAFSTPPLRALKTRLASQALFASAALRRLASRVSLVEARRNPLLAPLQLLLLYPLLTALAAERWRRAHGPQLGIWLGVLGEFEALLSLAAYSYENPTYPFPEFLHGRAEFRATGLGHPLIAATARVCNDVEIAGDTRVLLVSGSNMSGKSTLLRAVGVNVVLAMAGGPVCAARLQLTALKVGASIRVNDSLHEGSSRFYAEITRLRRLFEPSSLPLLFLLDELLQGTNSADRRIGAQGVVRALIERGGIGLISTHDLALTDLTGPRQGVLRNVHLQDELKDGVLRFDFKLREGVVAKSNGIELMRSIGLDV